MAGGGVVRQAIQKQRNLRVFDDFNLGYTAGGNRLGLVLRDFVTGFDDDFAGAVAAGRIAHVIDRDLAFNLGHAAAIDDFFARRFIELAENIRVRAVLGAHGPQQRESIKLAALIDADAERFTLRGVELDPATTLGNDAAARQLAIA